MFDLPPSLVLVVPCYKEALRLPRLLPGLVEGLKDLPCMIQVVDDGSPGPDVEPVRALVQGLRLRFPDRLAPLLVLPRNQGKGAAVRAGWLAHRDATQWAFVDADGSISPQEVRRMMIQSMAQPNRGYFASRVKMLGRDVHRTWMRHINGRIFATLSSICLKVDVYDSQCGFKILPSFALIRKIDCFRENGFAFDLEILMALWEQNVPIEEVPIDWTHISGSKVRLFRDSIAMTLSVMRIARRRSIWKA